MNTLKIMVIIIWIFLTGCISVSEPTKTLNDQEESQYLNNTVTQSNNTTEIQLSNTTGNHNITTSPNNTELSENNKITTWHYQLQNAKYHNLINLNVDLIVIDPDDANLTYEQLKNIKKNKIVLAYLSIGEAENYREYWKEDWRPGNPEFLDNENPEWEGNYKVKFWYPEWQKIILNRTQDLAHNYDGLYLDIVDAYEYYNDYPNVNSTKEMIEFVKKIKETGRKINPNFLIIPQNSPELYEYDEYQKIIDGIGIEDTWYDDDTPQDNKYTKDVIQYLEQIKNDGKIVLSIDYPTKKDYINGYYIKCKSHGFACTVSNRELNMDISKTIHQTTN
ncbi:endo alpha-1,4 polygalactosaminidase [Candidatus Micrarchaeota archaeon]|nr:endo alpha-1,4 polygalactosaminidase [Candidatus Micrarchaeota archaeon]